MQRSLKSRQVHNGISVVNTRTIFFINAKGDILSTVVDAYPGITLDTRAAIAGTQANTAAREVVPELAAHRLAQKSTMKQEPAQLVILPETTTDGVTFDLAWRVVVVSDTGPVEVMVDASTSEILAQRRLASDFRNTGDVQFYRYEDPAGFTSSQNMREFDAWEQLQVWIYGYSSSAGYVGLGLQYVTPSSPQYDITWSGTNFDSYWLYFIVDGTHSQSYQWKQFTPSSNFAYDIGSALSTSPAFSYAGGVSDRAHINIKRQCEQMHAFFKGIDNNYNKAKVYVQVVDIDLQGVFG